jgi:hypothetical protein
MAYFSKADFLNEMYKANESVINESAVNEAAASTFVYEIATPAPVTMLVKELTKLFPKKEIITDFESQDGLESVLMFNLSQGDIKKIMSNIDELLIFQMELTNRRAL